MSIEIVASPPELAVRAADIICEALTRKPACVLGLPTGMTPIGAYRELARRVAVGECDCSRATVFAIDEFLGVTRETPGTNSVFLRTQVAIAFKTLHIANPAANDPDKHIAAFAEAIERAGGFDLCVLGIGVNGHIAFNEPGSARDSRARVVDLTPESRRAHAASFGSLDAVPSHGLTLGVADLLESRAVLVLASGSHKAEAVARSIDALPSADTPASWLQGHADVTWLIDEAAAGLLAAR
jgi:glucosamine-6-phosphate deaminase